MIKRKETGLSDFLAKRTKAHERIVSEVKLEQGPCPKEEVYDECSIIDFSILAIILVFSVKRTSFKHLGMRCYLIKIKKE